MNLPPNVAWGKTLGVLAPIENHCSQIDITSKLAPLDPTLGGVTYIKAQTKLYLRMAYPTSKIRWHVCYNFYKIPTLVSKLLKWLFNCHNYHTSDYINGCDLPNSFTLKWSFLSFHIKYLKIVSCIIYVPNNVKEPINFSPADLELNWFANVLLH